MRHSMMIATLAGGLFATAVAPSAEAAVVAAYAEGHAGMSSASSNETTTAGGNGSDGAMPGLGFQLGARVLIFEGYFDHTSLDRRASINRGIFGLRGALGTDDLRFIFRGGVGALAESGGALTGPTLDGASRVGGVARLGLALEDRLARTLYLGLNLDGETFAFPATSSEPAVRGSDVFLSLGLKFELGI